MDNEKKNASRTGQQGLSRRGFMAAAGAAAGGVLASGAIAGLAHAKVAEPQVAPALPWKWVKLDPQEAGERAFRLYHEKGG